MKITKDCKVKAKYIEINDDQLIDSLIDYYKKNDEYTYLSLKKDQLKNKTKTLERIMEGGGGSNIKKMIETRINKKSILEIDVELISDNILIIINNKNFDDTEEFTYNEELDLYVNVTSKIFVNPDNHGAKEIFWYGYLRLAF